MEEFHQWMMLLVPVVAHGAAVVRIVIGRPAGKHIFLLALLVSMLALETAGNLVHGHLSHQTYFRFWLAVYLVNFGLVALALTEACTHSLDSYERFGEVGRRIIRAILVSSGIAMLLLLFALPNSLAEDFVAYFQAQAYLAPGSLALLGLSLLAFAKWARLRLHRNAKLTMIALTGLCAVEGLLGSTISVEWLSARMYLGLLSTLVFWGMLILRWSSQPEEERATASRNDQTDVAPALARMKAMNRQLGDLVRRG